ncbi:MAG: hypothetical protein JHC98_09825 [Thermoleophilaceae bacterium]|nr:hypothetical protein [Thermoleophilaceae bacterium]
MRPIALLVAATALLISLPAEAQAFRYTHGLTMTAQLTDRWTVKDTSECGVNGGGSVNLNLRTVGSTRFRPYYDRKAPRRLGPKHGNLVLTVPQGSLVVPMPPRLSIGTIETVDNTYIPPDPDIPEDFCPELDKSGCGAFPVVDAFLSVGGSDPRHLYATAAMPFTGFSVFGAGPCQLGMLDGWAEPPNVSINAPSPSVLTFGPTSARAIGRYKYRAFSRTTYETMTTVLSDSVVVTDDITRTITVKIAKL